MSKILTVLLCMIVLSDTAYTQSEENKQRQLLLNKLCAGNSKAWKYDTVISKLGSGCVRGIIYTFYRSGKLAIQKCINNEWNVEAKAWAFGEVNNLDAHILIDNEDFLLLIYKHPKIPNGEEMILRKIDSYSLTSPTIDKKFFFEVE